MTLQPAPTTDGHVSGGHARSLDARLGRAADVMAVVAVLFTGAIFGFFYAWVCSTMWGLDDLDPRVAIAAMQGMNASVRNAVFFPAFFLTPVVLGVVAVMLRRSGRRSAAFWFGAAAAVYLVGGLIVTMVVNVPMNEDLAAVSASLERAEADEFWRDYSGTWQVWNTVRTIASGLSLGLATYGVRAAARTGRS